MKTDTGGNVSEIAEVAPTGATWEIPERPGGANVGSPTLVSSSTVQADPDSAPGNAGIRLFVVRLVNYLTNHVIAHVPSYTIRHAWYRKVLGIDLAPSALVHLGAYITFQSLRETRRIGARIGRNSRINRDSRLDLRGGLTIGENVSISAEVLILTVAGQATSRSMGERKPVTIEDNAWIGTRAMVMPGVTVGRGAVVGAGAVVMQNVPPLAIVFGSPARAVGKRSEEEADYFFGGPPPLFE